MSAILRAECWRGSWMVCPAKYRDGIVLVRTMSATRDLYLWW